jgi:hypothetical protein
MLGATCLDHPLKCTRERTRKLFINCIILLITFRLLI